MTYFSLCFWKCVRSTPRVEMGTSTYGHLLTLVIYSYFPLFSSEAPMYICLWRMTLTSNHEDLVHELQFSKVIKWLLISVSVTL